MEKGKNKGNAEMKGRSWWNSGERLKGTKSFFIRPTGSVSSTYTTWLKSKSNNKNHRLFIFRSCSGEREKTRERKFSENPQIRIRACEIMKRIGIFIPFCFKQEGIGMLEGDKGRRLEPLWTPLSYFQIGKKIRRKPHTPHKQPDFKGVDVERKLRRNEVLIGSFPFFTTKKNARKRDLLSTEVAIEE